MQFPLLNQRLRNSPQLDAKLTHILRRWSSIGRGPRTAFAENERPDDEICPHHLPRRSMRWKGIEGHVFAARTANGLEARRCRLYVDNAVQRVLQVAFRVLPLNQMALGLVQGELRLESSLER